MVEKEKKQLKAFWVPNSKQIIQGLTKKLKKNNSEVWWIAINR
jgi:hypothetical protein